jgi:hypothetical protein
MLQLIFVILALAAAPIHLALTIHNRNTNRTLIKNPGTFTRKLPIC